MTETKLIQVADCCPVIRAADRQAKGAVTFSIDWFQATYPRNKSPIVRELVKSTTGRELQPISVPREQAYGTGVGCSGIALYSDNNYGHETGSIVLPGATEPTKRMQLIANLIAIGAKVTRVDFAFDDKANLTRMHRLLRSWVDGNAVTRFTRADHRREYASTGEKMGETMLIGSRKSETCIRVYEKQDFIRWELEVKGRTAVSMFSALGDEISLIPDADLLYAINCKAFDLLNTRISFRHRRNNSNISRAPVECWWHAFTSTASPEAMLSNDIAISCTCSTGEANYTSLTRNWWELLKRVARNLLGINRKHGCKTTRRKSW